MKLDEKKLWIKYHKTKTKNNKSKLLAYYYPFILSISFHFLNSKNTINFLSQDEIVSILTISLNDCIDKFDITKGAKFTTFARYRMIGAVKDFYRTNDYLSRKDRENLSIIQAFQQKFSNKHGRLPSISETSKELKIEQSTIGTIGELPESNFVIRSPEDQILLSIDIKKLLKKLSPREQQIIKEFVIENKKVKYNYQKYGVSQSRISQIKQKALIKLKKMIKDEYNNR